MISLRSVIPERGRRPVARSAGAIAIAGLLLACASPTPPRDAPRPARAAPSPPPSAPPPSGAVSGVAPDAAPPPATPAESKEGFPPTWPSTCNELREKTARAGAVEYLLWATAEQVSNRGADTSVWHEPRAIALVTLEGSLAWCSTLPEGFSRVRFSTERVRGHHDTPERHPLAEILFPTGSVWLYASGQLAGFRRDGGALLLSHAIPKSPEGPTFFDAGRFEVTTQATHCEGATRGPEIFVECGGDLVVFSGSGFSVVRPAPARVRGAVPLYHRRHVTHGKSGAVVVQMRAAGTSLRIDGQIYMK